MTDRELLKLAAKAQGSVFAENADKLPGLVCANNGDWRYGWTLWNPLANDGEGARLESALNLEVYWSTGFVSVRNARKHIFSEPFTDHGGDKQKARRLASVRAAASIAEGSKEP